MIEASSSVTELDAKESSERFQEWWGHTNKAARSALRSIPSDILEDVLQDLVIEVLERRKRGQGIPSVAFGVQFAKWRSLDRLRRRRDVSLEHAPVMVESPQQEGALAIQEILSVTKQLPEAQREAVRLWMAGHETREIARLTGKKETTIRSLLRHARYRLAMVLGEK